MEFTDPGDILLLGLETKPVSGRILLIDPLSPLVGEKLRTAGNEVIEWSWMWSAREVVAWPPVGAFDAVILHLPANRELTDLVLEVAASRLAPGGTGLIYGPNQEGIKSVADHLAPWFEQSEVVVYKHRQRVVAATRTSVTDGLRASLEQWERTMKVPQGERSLSFVSYPGMFAHGVLDKGTQLLLKHLPECITGAKVLDMGSGTGVLARALQERTPTVSIDAVDVNRFAIEATTKNVPGVHAFWGDSWKALPKEAKYDVIISNPPVHRGTILTTGPLEYFITDLKTHLVKGGSATLVVQGTIPVKRYFDSAGLRSTLMAEDTTYQVWQARLGE
jgi:16S rRNA (guanine1207-N2)-methyltransferase